MSDPHSKCSRRDFLKTAGAAGMGTLLCAHGARGAAAEKADQVPRRPFGNTGAEVPILAAGTSINLQGSQLLLRQALNWGVSYWDTAHSYGGGRSEEAIGKYLGKYPQDRAKIFLVTKSGAWSVKGLSRDLDSSLARMQTDHVDLFFIHGISDIDEMDREKQQWAEKMKAAGKIRLFGFSSHSNMAACLQGAAGLPWIDGIMMTYNYRLMHSDAMKRAVDACASAGIGLTAMKTQGGGQVRTDSDTELALAGRFMQKGFSDAQARLKAVWENPQIASICSEMPNMSILMANTAAALDKTSLSARDLELLERHAVETAGDYCAGCASICEAAVSPQVPIGRVMRYLMYSRSYGDRSRAQEKFRRLPAEARAALASADYAEAERRCPRKMAIARLMRAALDELS